MKIFLAVAAVMLLVGHIIFLCVTDGNVRADRRELAAYRLVSQERGVVIVNPDDDKKFVSFALRAASDLPESPEFIAALESLKNIPDLRGVNLEQIDLDRLDSFKALESIKNLESVVITNSRAAGFWQHEFMMNRPDVMLVRN